MSNLAGKEKEKGAPLVKVVQDAINAGGFNGYANLYKVIVNF